MDNDYREEEKVLYLARWRFSRCTAKIIHTIVPTQSTKCCMCSPDLRVAGMYIQVPGSIHVYYAKCRFISTARNT